MAARFRPVGFAVLLAAAGCLTSKDQTLQTVPPGMSGPSAIKGLVKTPQLSPASKEEAIRIDMVGQKLMAANRQAGLRPMFTAIGVPTSELFHRGTDALFVTEGLTKKCATEGQLAALLAYEVGRMVAEREAIAPARTRRPERLPPLESGVGLDARGPFGAADATHLAELARHDLVRPKPGATPLPPPDPLVLARGYLEKAGFTAQDLDDIAPLLKEARANDAIERQLNAGPVRPWTQ